MANKYNGVSERSIVLIKTGKAQDDIKLSREVLHIDCLINKRKDKEGLKEWIDNTILKLKEKLQYTNPPIALSMSGWSNENINILSHAICDRMHIDSYILNTMNPDANHYTDISFRPSLPLMHQERTGPFDIVGDIHGCYDEFVELIEKAGYRIHDNGEGPWFSHPDGRVLVSVGDLCDKGPDSLSVMELIYNSVDKGDALAITGNHERKIARHLMSGIPPDTRSNAHKTYHEIMSQGEGFVNFIVRSINSCPTHLILDNGKIAITHGAYHPSGKGLETNKAVNEFFTYGPLSKQIDQYGNIVRLDWMHSYEGDEIVFYGHTPCLSNPRVIGKTICMDGGGFGGGNLMLMKYPEFELIKVPTQQVYEEYPYFNFQDAEPEFNGKQFIENYIAPQNDKERTMELA